MPVGWHSSNWSHTSAQGLCSGSKHEFLPLSHMPWPLTASVSVLLAPKQIGKVRPLFQGFRGSSHGEGLHRTHPTVLARKGPPHPHQLWATAKELSFSWCGYRFSPVHIKPPHRVPLSQRNNCSNGTVIPLSLTQAIPSPMPALNL